VWPPADACCPLTHSHSIVQSLRNDLPGDAKKGTKKNAKSKSFLMPDSDDEAKSAIDMKEAGPLLQVEFHRVILDEVSVRTPRRTSWPI
jgi:hypothetical protein